jgi:hypothetical protein
MASRNAKDICDLESHDRAPTGDRPPAEVSSLTAFTRRVIGGPSTVSDSRLPEYEDTKGSKAMSWKRGREAGVELTWKREAAFLRNRRAEWDHGIRRNSLTTQFQRYKEVGTL